MRKGKGLGFLAMAAAMMTRTAMSELVQNESKPEPKDKIPDGCEKYYFDRYGNCINSPETAVFECVARNYKNAERKYQNWRNNQ